MQIAKATNILATDGGATDSLQKPHVKFATYYRTRRNHLVVVRADCTKIFEEILSTLKCMNTHQSQLLTGTTMHSHRVGAWKHLDLILKYNIEKLWLLRKYEKAYYKINVKDTAKKLITISYLRYIWKYVFQDLIWQ